MEPDPIIAIPIVAAIIAGFYFVRWWNKYETLKVEKMMSSMSIKEAMNTMKPKELSTVQYYLLGGHCVQAPCYTGVEISTLE